MQLPRSAAAAPSAAVLLVSWLAFLTVSACSKEVPGTIPAGPISSGNGGTAAVTNAVTPSNGGAPPASMPTSDQPSASPLPAAVWIDVNALPLNDSQHWPDLASIARPLSGDPFEIQSLCQITPDDDRVNAAQSARARIDRGATSWSPD